MIARRRIAWLGALGAIACVACPPAAVRRHDDPVVLGGNAGSGRRQYPRPADDERRPEPVPHRPVTLVELREESAPLVTFRVTFESGSADDPGNRAGLTRLLAHAMTAGGTEALTYEELTRRLFPMAARIDVEVDRDMTVFVGQVHRDHVAAFYPLFRDVLLHPRLADDDVRRVTAQAVSELTEGLRGSDDESLGKEILQSLIYQGGHPYGHPTVGTETGLTAITAADVRAHRARVFCRDRVTGGIAGGYPAELAAQLVRDLEQLPEACAPVVALPPVERARGVHVVVVDKPTASATAISVGFALSVTRADPDFAAVQFATNYLGLHRQSSGVLFNTIREARGLNYGDYAYGEHFEQEAHSRFPRANVARRQQYASLWLRPLRPPTAHFALRAAVRALTRALEQGIPAADFERQRAFQTAYIGLYTQTASARLGYALDDVWLRRIAPDLPAGSFVERTRTVWSALDRDAVLAAARRHLTARDLWIAIVAPDARALADAIGRNAPSPIAYDTPKPASVTAEDQEIQGFALDVRPEDVRVVPVADVFR